MKTKEKIKKHHDECEMYKKVFKHGPWHFESNREEWEYKGMPCLAVRQPRSGHWCGYVELSPGHKYYGIDDREAFGLSLGHGGITYGRFCEGNVCHISDNEKLYWLGFDCSHSWDIRPGDGYFDDYRSSYKDILYVKRHVEEMVEELLND